MSTAPGRGRPVHDPGRAKGPFDAAYAERWAVRVGRVDALHHTFARADEIERNT